MRTETLDAARGGHLAVNHAGGKRGRNHPASVRIADLRDALQRLDDSAYDLREALRLDDGSDQGRIALAAARRTAAEKLEAVLRQIAPAISEAEYHEPGIQQDFYSTWLEWLTFDCHQGAGTLMAHLARTRSLLQRAIGADDPVGTRAGKATSRPAEAADPLQLAGPDVATVIEQRPIGAEELALRVAEKLTGWLPTASAGATLPSRSDEGLLKERDAAKRLGLSVQTLRKWRAKGEGPRHVKLGKAVRYPVAEIDRFVRALVDAGRPASAPRERVQ
jgi:predicted DNA-binding transcriptional regulator AlpA